MIPLVPKRLLRKAGNEKKTLRYPKLNQENIGKPTLKTSLKATPKSPPSLIAHSKTIPLSHRISFQSSSSWCMARWRSSTSSWQSLKVGFEVPEVVNQREDHSSLGLKINYTSNIVPVLWHLMSLSLSLFMSFPGKHLFQSTIACVSTTHPSHPVTQSMAEGRCLTILTCGERVGSLSHPAPHKNMSLTWGSHEKKTMPGVTKGMLFGGLWILTFF